MQSQRNVDNNLLNLTSDVDTDCALWRATKWLKQPIIGVPPLRNTEQDATKKNLTCLRSNQDTFQPQDAPVDTTPKVVLSKEKTIKIFFPRKMTAEVVRLRRKRASGLDSVRHSLDVGGASEKRDCPADLYSQRHDSPLVCTHSMVICQNFHDSL